MNDFTVYPAIDVRAGRVVRLRQGDYRQETRYDDDPLTVARRYADAGATWLHLVDLDAARVGGYTLHGLLRDIVEQTGLNVQTGGGIRDREGVTGLLDAGASRVVVGSLAVREPIKVLEWIDEYGSQSITVALDTRQDSDGVWRLPVHGWTEVAVETLDAFATRFACAGLQHLLCTDIARDGMLQGPNIELYRELTSTLPNVALQASGGVRDLDDIIAARDAGCGGVVLGKALLEGRFDLAEALKC